MQLAQAPDFIIIDMEQMNESVWTWGQLEVKKIN
jgi:hypothetical protein